MIIARGILLAHWPSLCTDQREEGLSTKSQAFKEEIALGVIVLRWKPNSKIEREKAVHRPEAAKMAQDIS